MRVFSKGTFALDGRTNGGIIDPYEQNEWGIAMKNRFQRILSGVLAAVLVFGMMPQLHLHAHAVENTAQPAQKAENSRSQAYNRAILGV